MSLIATFAVDDEDEGATKHGKKRLRHSIYLGGKADAKDYDKLVQRWKITHILNCTPPKQTNIEAGVPNYFETSKQQHQTKRLQYHRIPVYDSPAALPELRDRYETEIIRFITKALCHGNVLVHCSRGISRSTTAVCLYLMAKRGMRYPDALATIRRRRPSAQPIPAFETWLRERDEHYHGLRNEPECDASGNRKKRKHASANPAVSIGPALPPKKKPANMPDNQGSIGPAPPPSTVPEHSPSAIGPEPPPPAAPKAASIGPVLPPKNASHP